MYETFSLGQVVAGIGYVVAGSTVGVLVFAYVFTLAMIGAKIVEVIRDLIFKGYSEDWEKFKYRAIDLKYKVRRWGRPSEEVVLTDETEPDVLGPPPENVVPFSLENIMRAERRRPRRPQFEL